MNTEPSADISMLLHGAAHGEIGAVDALVTQIYNELRVVSASLLRNERADHTLQPTALVNEALLRLLGPQQLAALDNRKLLYSAAARAMRNVLVDYARSRKAQKRGGGWECIAADEALDSLEQRQLNFESLQLAMDDLAKISRRAYEVVDLRFFGGMTVTEIAVLLNVSPSTVEKDLRKAREFLRVQLSET